MAKPPREKDTYAPEYLRRRIAADFERLRRAGWHEEALIAIAMKACPDIQRPKVARKSLARRDGEWLLSETADLVIALHLGLGLSGAAAMTGRTVEGCKRKWERLAIAAGLPRPNDDWTPRELDELIRLRRSGMGCAEVGKVLGRTKNAVIAKYWRLMKDRGLDVSRALPKPRRVLWGVHESESKVFVGGGRETVRVCSTGNSRNGYGPGAADGASS